VEEKHPLDTDTLKDTPDCDCLVNAAIPHGDHRAFVGLNPFLAAFTNADTNADGIANIDCRQVGFELFRF
jgi:hypothetical protein